MVQVRSSCLGGWKVPLDGFYPGLCLQNRKSSKKCSFYKICLSILICIQRGSMLSSQIWSNSCVTWWDKSLKLTFFWKRLRSVRSYHLILSWIFSCMLSMLFEYKTTYVPQEQENRSYWFVTLEHWKFSSLVSITLHIFMVNPTYSHQNYRDPNKVVGEPLISKWCSQQGLSNIWLLHDSCNAVCFLLCVWLFPYLFSQFISFLASKSMCRSFVGKTLRYGHFNLWGFKFETTQVPTLHLEQ